jgi:hypothetical protein
MAAPLDQRAKNLLQMRADVVTLFKVGRNSKSIEAWSHDPVAVL